MSDLSARLRVAAICTIYHEWSHADAIVTKFLKGMSTDEGFFPPEVDVVSMYIDHVLENDIGLSLAEEHGVPVYSSIRRALHAGGDKLGVDAVLLIGEHGDYPWNERGRHMYPRRYFFEQVAGVFGESGRSVPVFNDKHFAYDYTDAQWTWTRAKELGVPLMAGSCLPVSWRSPWVEHDGEHSIEEAVAIGYGGIEAYGYHTLETLQCMVERRPGGEMGIASVQCLEGDEVWRSRDRGLWSRELAEAACAAIQNKPAGSMEEHAAEPAVFLIEHRDGLKTAALMLNGYVSDWAYAARVRHSDGEGSEIAACEFYLQPDGPGASFGYLSRNIQRFFQTGVAPYAAERTLLTTGVIDAAMISRSEDHRLVETPYLGVSYESYAEMPIRPLAARPHGASLDREAPDLLLPWRS